MPSRNPRHPSSFRRGFSIIELIVVIGVVMVLLGIFLPALRGARQSARQTKSLSQVRQMATFVSMYCDTHDDVYPVADERFWFVPATPLGEPPYEPGRWWAYPFIDLGYFTVEDAHDQDHLDAANRQLSIAMCYDPTKMRPDTIEPYEIRVTSAIKQSSVRYPSGKGMIWTPLVQRNPDRYWCCIPGDPPGPVAFADTSAESIAWQDFDAPDPAPLLGIGQVVQSTWFGIYGKDR